MSAPFTAQQSLDRARALLQSGRGAALPELLKLIETLSLNICEVTVSELADLIEKDAVVLAKIITVANTLAHNPGIAPLTTLSQAIHQLGYNRIRTIAVSLMLLNTAGDAHPVEQREAATHALCAGLLAQGTAESLGTHDPEFAFACTALRGFGRILFAAISPEHYRAAALRVATLGEPIAYRSQFGITPLEFTRKLLAAARLPEEVLRTLRDAEPESLAGVSTTYDARLLGIVDFSTRLATLTLDHHPGSDSYLAKIRALARRYERLIPGAADVAKPALQRTEERIRNFTRSHGGSALPPESLARIRLRLRQVSPTPVPPDSTALTPPTHGSPGTDSAPLSHHDTAVPPESPAEETATPTTPDASPPLAVLSPDPNPSSDPTPTAAAAPPEPAPAPWDAPLADAHAFEVHALTPPPTDPLLHALAHLRTELAASECWFFRAGPGETELNFAHGLGHACTEQPAAARLTATERSVFGVCLQRREIVLIHDTADTALLPYLPAWFRKTTGAPAAFSLIPLRTPDDRSALLLIGWGTPRRIVLAPAQISLARQLPTSAQPPTPVAA